MSNSIIYARKARVFSFLLFLFLSSIYIKAQNGVLPKPVWCESGNESWETDEAFVQVTNLKKKERSFLINFLQKSWPLKWEQRFSKHVANGKRLELQCINDTQRFVSDEAYELEVTSQFIRIEARNSAGLFYGLQTLLQIKHGNRVNGVRVKDAPRFTYRGVMIDVSRHFYPLAFLKKQIDVLAAFKLNRLHLHLTDAAGWRFEIKKYPELTRFAAWRTSPDWKTWWNDGKRHYAIEGTSGAFGGYYTQKEMKELVEYASQRQVTIIPEIEMPAHSEEVLAAYPQLSCEGIPYKNADFCAGNEDTFRFLEYVLHEVASVFPSEYLHVGGDEAGKAAWHTCPKCQGRMKEEGYTDVEQLQSYFMRRVGGIVEKLGRKMIGWDEVMQGGILPDNTAVMVWRDENLAKEALEKGYPIVLSPGKWCYLDAYQDNPFTQPEAIGGYLPLQKVYAYNPTVGLNNVEKVMGIQGNLWTEYISREEQIETMLYPRALAIAEIGWTPQKERVWEDFRIRALYAVEQLKNKGYHPFELSKEYGNRKEAEEPLKCLSVGKKVKYNAPWHVAYPGAGGETLTDGLRGGWTYGDGRWQGFINKQRLDVVIDLEHSTEVHVIKADFMQSPGPEVYYPAHVTISVSKDGEVFTPVHSEDYPTSNKEPYGFRTYEWSGKVQARYVRFQAQAGSYGGWVFTDEIIINGL